MLALREKKLGEAWQLLSKSKSKEADLSNSVDEDDEDVRVRWRWLQQMFVLNELHWADVELRAEQYSAHYPRTVYGYLVHALLLRKILGLKPWTILSCDNIPSNGALVKRLLLQFLNALVAVEGGDPKMKADKQYGGRGFAQDLYDWVEKELKCPCSMVDRIVPATTEKDCDALLPLYRDEGIIFTEPYCTWVLEKDFVHEGVAEALQEVGSKLPAGM